MKTCKHEVVYARAPVRILDLGGWTDIRLFPQGKVLNFAVKLYTYARVEPLRRTEELLIESQDIDESEYVKSIRDIEYKGTLSLLKAGIRRTGLRGGLNLSVSSEAPPASGLGSSASLGVALTAALNRMKGRRLLSYGIARTAHALETEELHLECGVQDQMAAAYGGINYLQVRYPEAAVLPVAISDKLLCEMEQRLLLVYTGKSHFSSKVHKLVISRYRQKDPGVVKAFANLMKTADLGLDALLGNDLPGLAEAMNLNWASQKKLHPSVTTEDIERLHRTAFKHGALGFKINGAGGGGTAVILCGTNREKTVEKAIRRDFPYMTIYNVKLDLGRCQGVQTWTE